MILLAGNNRSVELAGFPKLCLLLLFYVYLCWLCCGEAVDYPFALFELRQERCFFLCRVFEMLWFLMARMRW
jgi:hypothetical protein